MSEKKYIQSIERATMILDYIANNGCAKLNDISNAVSLKTSTTFGILQTLEHTGYIVRTNGGLEYTLGLNCLKLGLSFQKKSVIHQSIHSLLEALVAEINETAYFEIKIGDRYYYLDVVVSTQSLKVVPDHDDYIDLPEKSAIAKVFNGITDDFTYATDLEEVEEGLNCFAVPYRTGDKLIGCIVMTGPSYRFTQEKIEYTYRAYLDIMARLGLTAHIW
jgi:DNA-binding IclR family transcriptional regulator